MNKIRPQVLITAGNTREKIDSVRCWSNIFTGQTGLDIAHAVSAIADVTLLTSNAEHVRQIQGRGPSSALTAILFESHADLLHLIATSLAAHLFDAVFMTAAVSDYTPDGAYTIIFREPTNKPNREVWVVDKVQQPKISSRYESVVITGKPTLKIIDQFRKVWKYRGLLFKFKLEVGLRDDELIAVAQKSRKHSHADVIVANTLEMTRGPEPAALIIDQQSARKVPRAQLAEVLRNELTRRLGMDAPNVSRKRRSR
ncbi:MAG: phosphopantothenoylcysteine decarboxylase [Phycisphaerae bacterium]